MIKKQFELKSANGKDMVKYYVCAADNIEENIPKAILQISHGMCEFFDRYLNFAEYLTNHGILVCGNDHLGHGECDLQGYFSENEGYVHLCEDVHCVTKEVKKMYPNTPHILHGHSMGSFIARNYLSKYARELDGCIIMGTGGSNPLSHIAISLAKRIKKRKGDMHRSAFLNKMAFGAYNKHFKETGNEFDWLSRDEKVVLDFEKNPRCNYVLTVSAFHDLLMLQCTANDNGWYETVPKDLPILLVSGDMDPVGDYGKGPKEVYDKLKKAGVSDVQIKLYPDFRHEILNEIGKEEVYEDVLEFIEKVYQSEIDLINM